jgi:metal-responsive CopG/Arc/MetJ family transcriptional regulator
MNKTTVPLFEAIKTKRQGGRPREKARVRHVTLFMNADLLDEFDALCDKNMERSRTAVVEALMRLYLEQGQKTSKEEVIARVSKLLAELL